MLPKLDTVPEHFKKPASVNVIVPLEAVKEPFASKIPVLIFNVPLISELPVTVQVVVTISKIVELATTKFPVTVTVPTDVLVFPFLIVKS